jgi:oligopeptide/dipeptide ABC transporter ATP-binding protein
MMLEVKDLKMYFPVKRGLLRRTAGYVKAIDGVTFSIGKGETLGLVGESGCGKTTVGKCVVRLLRPTSGSIYFENNDISGLSPKELREYRKRMQIVFQDPFGSLNPRMTVSSIVGEGLKIMGERSGEKEVGELLETVGLSRSDGSRYPHEFSGGQRQRIGIARALAVGPSFLICDEPVSALDVSIQAQIINLLEELQATLSLSFLFIAHDLSVVRHIADRVVVMYIGKVMEEAPTEELFAIPLHPYTHALFSSIPSLDPARRRGLNPLPGEPPSPADPPPGCRFASRCPKVTAKCREGDIEVVEVSKNHRVRCILYG